MALGRLFGGGGSGGSSSAAGGTRGGSNEPQWRVTPAGPGVDEKADTQTVRRIVDQIASLPPERARFLAAFAYILTRAAAADLDISDVEERAIEQIVVEHGGLTEPQAVLVAQVARNQEVLFGATEDFLVTRQFRQIATPEQRLELLRCCYLVGAADDTITNDESDTLQEIAKELDVEPADVKAIRHEFEPKLAAIQALMRMRRGTEG
jgi:uncharacterized tellurite resistance protein B-like protein